MPDHTTVSPADTGAALENPSMGWSLNYHTNPREKYGRRLSPTDTLEDIPGLGVIYFRLPWSYLEPEEGCYDWSLIDGPAQRFIDAGKQVAFRFNTSDSNLEYATPEWVQEAGASGERFSGPSHWKREGTCWEPDFQDPVYLEKLDSFLAAAGDRYDGDPNVAFVEVGFGCWGEGHTHASTRRSYPTAARKEHIDRYQEHFPETLLVANDDFAFEGDALHVHDYEAREQGEMDEEIIAYAREQGLSMRDDSVLVQGGDRAYLSAEIMGEFWPETPVIIECEHYGLSKDRGAWDNDLYVEAIEAYHASYATIHWYPREFVEKTGDLLERINRRLGYRVRPTRVSWPTEAPVEGGWTVETTWQNDGVAPCYPGGHPAVTLKRDGGIVAVSVAESFDVGDLSVDAGVEIARGERERDPESRTCEIPVGLPATLDPGTYDLCVSVGTSIGTPRIEMPLEDAQRNRRYRLGEVTLD